MKFGKTKVKVKHRDLVTLLVCTLRYALPRHTYMTGDACRLVTKHLNIIPKNQLLVMLEDLNERLSEGRPNSTIYAIDYDEFEDLRDLILEELDCEM